MPRKPNSKEKLVRLRTIFSGRDTLLIVLQNRPDPDGLASGLALRRLANESGLQCSLACDGAIGRAENRALVRYTGVNLRPMSELDLTRFDLVAMVDTQPGHSNNSLPAGVLPDIVIDHHPIMPLSRRVGFTDIRRHYGAASTILYEYLQAASIRPDITLATALVYGIQSDTQEFERDTTQADIDAYGKLYALANNRMMGDIRRGLVPSEYYKMLWKGLTAARLCGRCLYCDLADVDDPDMLAELADLFLRHDQADWAVVWGVHNGKVMISVRAEPCRPDARDVVAALVAQVRHGRRGMIGWPADRSC